MTIKKRLPVLAGSRLKLRLKNDVLNCQAANSIDKAVKSQRSARQGSQVTPLQRFSKSVEESPSSFSVSDKLLMCRCPPLRENGGNLGHGQDACINSSNHEVMRERIANLHLLVSRYPLVLLNAHVGQTADRRVNNPRQVAANEASVPTGDGHLATERQVVTNRYRIPHRD